MVIYRGAGLMTLLMPIIVVLLWLWLWPDPTVKPGDVTLMQFLLSVVIGSLINVALGLVLNRGDRSHGVRHHFFYVPMQWPALAFAVVCGVLAVINA
ncbi:hypothetical protein SAMN05216588_1316 [Pseudomonas flavescens]|uniref:Uncharacterized protein n=1 Tax=Phytopseudomonas flavescens TaxID=29435 RepID=A0A1G8PV27_9GAMM|nr:hypothetical protein [Pseudomonas flavescens]SDI96075.1 hypothetical protein SAMN05216588_1316 [Pseudomonas flavescens]